MLSKCQAFSEVNWVRSAKNAILADIHSFSLFLFSIPELRFPWLAGGRHVFKRIIAAASSPQKRFVKTELRMSVSG
jgi:hypothetical protein